MDEYERLFRLDGFASIFEVLSNQHGGLAVRATFDSSDAHGAIVMYEGSYGISIEVEIDGRAIPIGMIDLHYLTDVFKDEERSIGLYFDDQDYMDEIGSVRYYKDRTEVCIDKNYRDVEVTEPHNQITLFTFKRLEEKNAEDRPDDWLQGDDAGGVCRGRWYDDWIDPE